MSLLGMGWRLLLSRGATHLLTALVVALGIGMMLVSIATGEAARGAMGSLAGRFPLVVGGEIGAVPLVLGSMTRLQDLGGGISGEVLHQLEDDPRVELAVPLLGGHSVGGYPLLGTSPDYLQPRSRYPLQAGRVFDEGVSEVVLGAQVATGLGVGIGDSLDVGHDHAGNHDGPDALQITGILEPTGTDTDTTLFCPLGAIFISHGAHDAHEQRIQAVLVRATDDQALLDLQEDLDALDGVDVALTGQTLRRASDQLSGGGGLIRLLVSGVVLITFFALLLSVYGTTMAQARDLAVMRVLGARRVHLVFVVLLITASVVALGVAGGLVLGEVLGVAAERVLRREMGLEATVTVFTATGMGWLGLTATLMLLAGVQPALAAYALEAAEALAETPGAGRSTRAWLSWSLRIVLPLIAALWLFNAFSQHNDQIESAPIDDASAAIFDELSAWSQGVAPSGLAALDGQPRTISGFMYTLGDPYTTQDFFLISMNPRLPRCPFCYRSPARSERIEIRTAGQTVDVCAGMVRVTGVLHVVEAGDTPLWMELNELEVVLP